MCFAVEDYLFPHTLILQKKNSVHTNMYFKQKYSNECIFTTKLLVVSIIVSKEGTKTQSFGLLLFCNYIINFRIEAS